LFGLRPFAGNPRPDRRFDDGLPASVLRGDARLLLAVSRRFGLLEQRFDVGAELGDLCGSILLAHRRFALPRLRSLARSLSRFKPRGFLRRSSQRRNSQSVVVTTQPFSSPRIGHIGSAWARSERCCRLVGPPCFAEYGTISFQPTSCIGAGTTASVNVTKPVWITGHPRARRRETAPAWAWYARLGRPRDRLAVLVAAPDTPSR